MSAGDDPTGPSGPSDRFRLDGRVAVVTGGSRGLGRAMVGAFAEAGADVVIASRDLEACRRAASEVAESTGRRAEPVAANVSRWADCDTLADATLEAFGRVDILVNNAGSSPPYPNVAEVSEELFDKVVALNLRGPFRLSARLGRHMAETNGGTVINISSVASVRPTADVVPYAAAKAGLNAMSRGMADALGPTVRVNTIMAGPFLTDIADAWDTDEVTERARRHFALGRLGRPDDIVGAALYLASDASAFATGAVIRLDGGLP